MKFVALYSISSNIKDFIEMTTYDGPEIAPFWFDLPNMGDPSKEYLDE
jgi:hypothetical protein